MPIGQLAHLAGHPSGDREVHRRRVPKAVEQGSERQNDDDQQKREAEPTNQPELSPDRPRYAGRVIAPSLAEETNAAYFAKTPVS